ncbi:MAG: L-threonylcarbamoyladenylate synthase [Pseudomonadota bacterium]
MKTRLNPVSAFSMSALCSPDDAVAYLKAGKLVALPTETVYGLAADAADGGAVAAIYETKGRPRFNPLILHVLDVHQAQQYGQIEGLAQALMDAFWPGPLTLVVPLRDNAPVASLVTAGLETIALRSPAHPTARQILAAFGHPFVAPSANRSGRISPTEATHVLAEFRDQVPVVDGGPCPLGVESTIVGLLEDKVSLLRPGSVTPEDIKGVIGKPLLPPTEKIQAPGMMTSHYAPSNPLRLNAAAPEAEERLLGFGKMTSPPALNLSEGADLKEAAANLFTYLRRLDESPGPIAVAPIPDKGLGIAINDRLRRAAAPKPS